MKYESLTNLRGSYKLEISDDPKSLLMHPEFFTLVASRSRLSPKNIDIARRVLVDKESRMSVVEDEGMTRQMLFKVLKSLNKDAQALLDSNELSVVEIIVDNSKRGSLEKYEDLLLSKLLTRDL